MMSNINNGKAYEKLLQMVERQGGDITYIENLDKFEKAKYVREVVSNKSGIIKEIPADVIAKYVSKLGAGRNKKEDSIDMTVGVVLHKKVGENVYKGDVLATICANEPIDTFGLDLQFVVC